MSLTTYTEDTIDWWASVAISLTILDAGLTALAVHFGYGIEQNPIWAWLIKTLAIWPAMGIRMAIGSSLCLLLAYLALYSRLAWDGLRGVTIILSFVFIWQVIGVLFYAL